MVLVLLIVTSPSPFPPWPCKEWLWLTIFLLVIPRFVENVCRCRGNVLRGMEQTLFGPFYDFSNADW